MQNYSQKIFKVFHQFGYQRNSTLSKKQVIVLINDISSTYSTLHAIDQEVINELWQFSKKNQNNKLQVIELCRTINQAIRILSQDYRKITKAIYEVNSQTKKKQLLLQLYEVTKSYEMLALPFGGPKLQQSQLIYQSLKLIPQQIRNKEKYIFSFDFTYETFGLKIVLWIVMLLLGIEVLMMFHKTHFYTLMCYCLVISIFLLNYFDAAFIRFLIANLFISTLFDVIWLICNAKLYWGSEDEDFTCFQHSTILKFSTLFVTFNAVGKIIMAGILFKYRNNPPDLCINLEFLDLRFSLDADPKNNPISHLF